MALDSVPSEPGQGLHRASLPIPPRASASRCGSHFSTFPKPSQADILTFNRPRRASQALPLQGTWPPKCKVESKVESGGTQGQGCTIC